MSGKRNVSDFRGHELANALYITNATIQLDEIVYNGYQAFYVAC